MIPGPGPAERTRLSRESAADAALISTLVAMRRSPGRYRSVVLKLVEAELRSRRWAAGSWEAPLAVTLPVSLPLGPEPVVPAVPTESVARSAAREGAPKVPTEKKHHGVEMLPKNAKPTGPARRQPARRPMSGEERGSLAAWSTLLAMVVVAFFTWSPSRPGRRGSEGLVKVVLPAPFDPALLATESLARLPLPAILEVANSSDAAARGRMISALVRRGAGRELAGLSNHASSGVRGAIPLALSSLGLVPSAEVGEYSARLLSPVASVRDMAARELANRVGRGPEEIARGL